ncbi:MAG: proton-conducting transporter membrane subunit, partial [Pseudomonadota bacterium]
ILMPLAILAMFAASLIAVFQSDLKRLLAYSSIAQIGYMILGVSLATQTSLTAAIVHLFNHGISKAALFMALGAYVMRSGDSFLNSLSGLGKRMPWTSAVFFIGGLSLIGVPGTAGFISKWVLVNAALELDFWWLALLIAGSSLLAVVYVWKSIEVLYLQDPLEGTAAKEAPLSMLIPMWVLAFACIYAGFDTDGTTRMAQIAAEGLLPTSGGNQ